MKATNVCWGGRVLKKIIWGSGIGTKKQPWNVWKSCCHLEKSEPGGRAWSRGGAWGRGGAWSAAPTLSLSAAPLMTESPWGYLQPSHHADQGRATSSFYSQTPNATPLTGSESSKIVSLVTFTSFCAVTIKPCFLSFLFLKKIRVSVLPRGGRHVFSTGLFLRPKDLVGVFSTQKSHLHSQLAPRKQTNENQSSWCIYGISPPMASVHHNCQKHVVRTPDGEASSLCGKAGPPTIVLAFSGCGRRDGLPLPTALRGGIPAAE